MSLIQYLRELRAWHEVPKAERIKMRITAVRWWVLMDLRNHDSGVKKLNRLFKKLRKLGIYDDPRL